MSPKFRNQNVEIIWSQNRFSSFDFAFAVYGFEGASSRWSRLDVCFGFGLLLVFAIWKSQFGKVVLAVRGGISVPGILILQLGSPIYFANARYIRERIARWLAKEENTVAKMNGTEVSYVVLDNLSVVLLVYHIMRVGLIILP